MGGTSFKDNIFYKHLFMRANDAIILYDEYDQIVDVNDKACILLGYTREEMLSFELADLKPAGWKEEFQNNRIEWEIDTFGNKSFATTDVRKDGSEIVIEVTNAVLHKAGKIYVFSIFRDKTEEQKARKELERSEAIKQSIMESTFGINIWAVDTKYRYTFFNEAHKEGMKKVWGAEIELGECLLDYLTDPEYREEARENYDRLFAGESYKSMDKLADKDGTYRYYENTGYPIYDEEGSITGATIFTTDVTERVNLQTKLKKTLALQESIMNSPPGVIIMSVDLEYRYIFFNNAHREAMIDIWEVEPRLGDNVLDILPDKAYRERVKGGYDRVLRGGNIAAIDEFYDKSGTKRYYKNISAPILDRNQEIIGLTLFILDITDQMTAEEKIKESLHEKEILLKEVHHRVKNNLQIISSMLNMQIDLSNNREIKLHFREAQSRINTMALIHDQLYQSDNLAKIEMQIYIRNLVSYVVDTYHSPSLSVNVEYRLQHLHLELDRAIPLGLIINELVSNAMKYAFRDRSEGKIKIAFEEAGKGEFILIIEDDGEGFAEGFDVSSLDTLGIKMIEALSQQLNGEFHMESVSGVKAIVTF